MIWVRLVLFIVTEIIVYNAFTEGGFFIWASLGTTSIVILWLVDAEVRESHLLVDAFLYSIFLGPLVIPIVNKIISKNK